MTWAWTETSSALVASSENDEFGFGGQGSGDADPLLLSAAEFVRVSEQMFSPQVHRVEQLGRPLQASSLIEAGADEKGLA